MCKRISKRIFSDESGSIPKKRMDKIFSVCLVKPVDDKELMRIFKHWKKQYCKSHNISPRDEIKGSQLTNESLDFIIKRMLPKTKVVYAWFNANIVKKNLLKMPKLTHNYLTWLAVEKMIAIEKEKNITFTMEIDTVNNSISSLNSLEDYINTQLLDIDGDIDVLTKYIDSKDSWSIQVADIFSHFVYRKLKSALKKDLDLIPQIFERKVY